MIPLAWLILASSSFAQHEHCGYPIEPVHAELRVEPDRVVVDAEGESTIWIEEILAVNPLPPTQWPPAILSRAENYVGAHFRLSADGVRLKGRLAEASFVQRPWQVYEQGRVRLRVIYPPVEPGSKLSGEVDFYEDYRLASSAEAGKGPLPYAEGYKTLLHAGSRRFELKPGAVAFEMDSAEARPGAAARGLVAFREGALAVLKTSSSWPALAALALLLSPLPPSRRRAVMGLLILAAGVCVSVLPLPRVAVWAAGLAAAAAAGGWLGRKASEVLAISALGVLGAFWGAEAWPWLPSAAPGAGLRAAAAMGTTAAVALALAAGGAAVRAELRRLKIVSESHSAEIFERRRRLAATALFLVCLLGAAQGAGR